METTFINVAPLVETVSYDYKYLKIKTLGLSCLFHTVKFLYAIYTIFQKARLHVGLYSVYLKDWFKVFPRNQFLVIRTEDYKINISSTLQRIYKHLGLSKYL